MTVRRTIRAAGRAVPLISACLAGPRQAEACAVCFAGGESSILQGSATGMFALLGVTLTMLAAFAVFFLTLASRARRARDVER